MDTSGLSGMSGAALALQYEVSVEKTAQDQQRVQGAGIVRLIEGAGNPQQPGPVVEPDGRGAHVNIKV
jgi:hypothetical protein